MTPCQWLIDSNTMNDSLGEKQHRHAMKWTTHAEELLVPCEVWPYELEEDHIFKSRVIEVVIITVWSNVTPLRQTWCSFVLHAADTYLCGSFALLLLVHLCPQKTWWCLLITVVTHKTLSSREIGLAVQWMMLPVDGSADLWVCCPLLRSCNTILTNTNTLGIFSNKLSLIW